LKNCAYIYENQKEYWDALEVLDKLLVINPDDSCYYGEMLNNLKMYGESIEYFTKAYNVDPENIHNFIKRAIAYYICKKYEEALLDFDRSLQLNFSNIHNFVYYYRGLLYFKLEDISNVLSEFRKCTDSTMLYYCLEDLLKNH